MVKISLYSMTFLMSGNTTEVLNCDDTVDIIMDKLTIVVKTESRISSEAFSKEDGMGSRLRDFELPVMMILCKSTSLTGVNS